MSNIQHYQQTVPFFSPRLHHLTDGQQALLLLLINKLRNEETVTLDEVVQVYQDYVQRDSKKWTIVGYGEEMHMGWEPVPTWEVRDRALQWLRHNIGSLVLKGYLTVVPKFGFSE